MFSSTTKGRKMTKTLEEVLCEIADGSATYPYIVKAVESAMELGFSTHYVEALRPGDKVCFIELDPFGFAPAPSAVVRSATVARLEETEHGTVKVHHGGGCTEAYPFEPVLSILS